MDNGQIFERYLYSNNDVDLTVCVLDSDRITNGVIIFGNRKTGPPETDSYVFRSDFTSIKLMISSRDILDR